MERTVIFLFDLSVALPVSALVALCVFAYLRGVLWLVGRVVEVHPRWHWFADVTTGLVMGIVLVRVLGYGELIFMLWWWLSIWFGWRLVSTVFLLVKMNCWRVYGKP